MPLKLYRRGKVWHYRGTVAGRLLRESTKTQSKEVAQRIAADAEQHAWKGHLDPQSVLTFAQAAMLYRQAQKMDRHLWKVEDYWKDTPVNGITAGVIKAAAVNAYPNSRPATRNRQFITPTQAVINHAAELEKCQRITVKRFEDKQKKVKVPAEWDWVQDFMRAAVAEGKLNLAALVCFMYLTGCRVGKAVELDWWDIDWRAHKVLIRASKKGENDRRAHMPSELIAALANIRGERMGLVFGYKRRAAGNIIKAVARRAGLRTDITPHSCRHGFASVLLKQGKSPVAVAARGGWKSAQHVLQTYGHDIDDENMTDVLTDTPKRNERKQA